MELVRKMSRSVTEVRSYSEMVSEIWASHSVFRQRLFIWSSCLLYSSLVVPRASRLSSFLASFIAQICCEVQRIIFSCSSLHDPFFPRRIFFTAFMVYSVRFNASFMGEILWESDEIGRREKIAYTKPNESFKLAAFRDDERSCLARVSAS